jgi:RNA polymerase sigma-70 factor, ECF subfamily
MSKIGVIQEHSTAASVTSVDDARRQRRVDELCREHGGFLRRLAASLCRSSFDPDDLFQDVLERTLHHFDRLPPGVDHRAWMARVMRNLFIDRVRRRATAPAAVELDDEPVSPPPPEDVAWWETLDADDIRARLREIPEELREAFALFALEGCSYQDIAARLGIPKATVGTRILRARRRIKQLFDRAHAGADGAEADDE